MQVKVGVEEIEKVSFDVIIDVDEKDLEEFYDGDLDLYIEEHLYESDRYNVDGIRSETKVVKIEVLNGQN